MVKQVNTQYTYVFGVKNRKIGGAIPEKLCSSNRVLNTTDNEITGKPLLLNP